MIVEVGHYALALAFCVSLFQGLFGLLGAQRKDSALMGCVIPAARIQFFFIAAAFSALTYANIVSDFSVWLVAEYSHTQKPLLYRISGVWGNHEGSMLLWVLILSLFGLLVSCFKGKLPVTFESRVLGVQALISSGFLAFVLFTSNPFLRLNPAPLEGRGLNPILQDPGLALHPPLLYLGYVGFSISFSFAVAALIEGRVDPAWARWVRPWILGAWSALTLGIGLGSWWAYYELGWGGWWFWDPVENASFMPWLIGTALLHSAFVVERRDTLKTWSILLAIGTFGFALLGTFLVRSGVLTSVHTFATDPERGIFILLLIVIIVGGSLVLFAMRAPLIKGEGLFKPISREGAIVLNNLFLTTACTVVLIGTLYPLIIDTLINEKLSVGPPFFNNTFVPLVVPLLIACPIGAIMPWKRGDIAGVLGRLKLAALVAIIISLGSISMDGSKNILAALFLGIAVWLIMGAFVDLAERVKLFRMPLKKSLGRAIELSSSTWGKLIAHSALGILVAGITGSTTWKIEKIQIMKPNDQIQISSYEVKFLGVKAHKGANYNSIKGEFDLSSSGKAIATLFPEKRTYPAERSTTTEAAIRTNFLGDIYIVLGDNVGESAWVTRIYYNPLVPWIWLGVLLMAIGGLISLLNRRLSIGALASSTQKTPV